MPRMLLLAVLALLTTACSSDGDSPAAPSLREVTAANQCMDQCQRRHDSCMTSRTDLGSDSCGTGVATRRDSRCDKIDNPDPARPAPTTVATACPRSAAAKTGAAA